MLTTITENNIFSKQLPNLSKIKYNSKIKHVNVSNVFFNRKHDFSPLNDRSNQVIILPKREKAKHLNIVYKSLYNLDSTFFAISNHSPQYSMSQGHQTTNSYSPNISCCLHLCFACTFPLPGMSSSLQTHLLFMDFFTAPICL